MSGTPAGEIPILEAVLPYIAVRVAKRRRWDDEEGEAEEGEGKQAKKQHGRKGRTKNKGLANAANALDANTAVDSEDVVMNAEREESAVVVPVEVADTLETTPLPADDIAAASTEPPEPVLVLRRIQTVEVEGTQLIVFNAVGYGFDFS